MTAMRESLSRLFHPRIEAVGLEIGTSALKVVELRGGKPPRWVPSARGPRRPGLLQEDEVVDAPGLAEEIKALFKEAGVSKRFVVTAVGNRQAITRNIFVPKMTLKELDEAIKWEAERYIPFPIDEVVLDYYVLDNPDDVEEEGAIRGGHRRRPHGFGYAAGGISQAGGARARGGRHQAFLAPALLTGLAFGRAPQQNDAHRDELHRGRRGRGGAGNSRVEHGPLPWRAASGS